MSDHNTHLTPEQALEWLVKLAGAMPPCPNCKRPAVMCWDWVQETILKCVQIVVDPNGPMSAFGAIIRRYGDEEGKLMFNQADLDAANDETAIVMYKDELLNLFYVRNLKLGDPRLDDEDTTVWPDTIH